MTRSSYLFGAFASILAASPQTASAQLRTVVGVLECRAGPATTFVVGSVRDFDCLFWFGEMKLSSKALLVGG